MTTKGEWEVARDTTYNTHTFVIGGDGRVVANTYFYWRKEVECEANAHLIAAAPDMYETLKSIIERLEKGLSLGEKLELQPAREALAKAEKA